MLGPGNTQVLVSPTSVGNTTAVLTVRFTGALAGADMPQLVPVSAPGDVTVTAQTVVNGAGHAVQQLTLGGSDGGTVTPIFNGVSSTIPLTFTRGVDEIQKFTLDSTGPRSSGAIQPSITINNVEFTATDPLPVINEVQQLRVLTTGTTNFSFNGVS